MMNMDKKIILGGPGEQSTEQEFQRDLEEILSRNLPMEYVDQFFEKALSDLAGLSERVRNAYLAQEPDKTALSSRAIEDNAFDHFHLKKIDPYLEQAGRKIEELRGIDLFIQKNIVSIPEIITPPKEGEYEIVPGAGADWTKKMWPRLKTLLYILKSNGVNLETLPRPMIGTITPDMMRKTSYVTVEITDFHRVVQLCDEIGNATYVFDTESLREAGIDIERLNAITKEEKNALIEQYPEIGRRMVDNGYWVSRIEELLYAEKFSDLDKRTKLSPEQRTRLISISELDPWKGFWTDESGKHWGSLGAMERNVSFKSKMFLERVVKEANPQATEVYYPHVGRASKAFCFEDMMEFPLVKKYLAASEVADEHEWKGFSEDHDRREHTGTVSAVQEKLAKDGFPLARIVIDKFIHDHTGQLRTSPVRDLSGKLSNGYSFEEISFLMNVEKLKKYPVLHEKDHGYYQDPLTSTRYGLMSALRRSTGLAIDTLKKIAEKNKIPKVILRKGLRLLTAYDEEKLINNEEVKKLLTLPTMEATGEWQGFVTDKETGTHWGGVNNIGSHAHVGVERIRRVIQDHPELETREVRKQQGIFIIAYCHEKVMEIYGSKNL